MKVEAAPGIWRILQYFSPYIRKQQKLLWCSAIALAADVGLRVLEPWTLKFVFDYVLIRQENPPNFPIIGTLEPVWLLAVCAVAAIAIPALRALAAYWNTVWLSVVGSRVMGEVREKLYCHLQQLSLGYHHRARSGDLIVRVSSDASRLQEILLTAALPLLVSVFTLLGMLAVMFWMDRDLTLLSLLMLPWFGLVASRLSDRIRESSLKQRKQEGAVAATAAESIAAIKLVKALSLQEAFARVFAAQNRQSLQESVRTQQLASNLERTVDVVIAIGTALVLWYGSWLALRDALTPGDVLVFLTYLKNAFKPVQNFAKYTGRLAKAAASGERIMDVLGEIPEVRDLPGAIAAPRLRGDVEFVGVSFGYEPGRLLLRDVNLKVQAGQQVAIVGASGGGKSTLLSLILRLYDPVAGSVRIDGRDLREYVLDSVRSQISVVLQESLLFAATIRENIAYGVGDVSEREILAAAELANAREFIENLSEGYDTVVGERGATLSGGQRQRIAIARAAIRQAPILILDEPTTGLDKRSEGIVIEALQRLARDRTTLIVTHDLHLAARCDAIVYVEGGEIQERGSHEELMALNGRYAGLYRIQKAGENMAIGS